MSSKHGMSASFNCLSDDIIKNYIISRFSLFIPDESTLILRAVCKRLYNMVPADAVSFRKRAKWLIDGKAEEWGEDMNSYELTCVIQYREISVSYAGICLERFGDGPDRFVFCPVEDTKLTFRGSTITMERKLQDDECSDSSRDDEFGYISEDEERGRFVKRSASAGGHISTHCMFGLDVIIILTHGTIVKTRVTSSPDEMFKLLQGVANTRQRRIILSHRYDGMYRMFRDMQTSDGEHLFVRDMHNTLYMIKWSGIEPYKTIDGSIRGFQVFDNSMVYLTSDGTLRLMRFVLKEDQKTDYLIVDLPTEKAIQFVAVPSRQHLWIISLDNRIIKYSMPSP